MTTASSNHFISSPKHLHVYLNILLRELEISMRQKLTREKPELTIASKKLTANNVIVLVKTNLCSPFLQNYFKKRGISVCEEVCLVAILTPTRYTYWQIESEIRSQSYCNICNTNNICNNNSLLP